MTKDAAEQIWKSYLEAYSNVSPEERRRLLELAVSDDIVSSNPGDESVGLENLIIHVEEFQQRLPGAYFKLNKLFFHHEQALSEWTLHRSDGTPLRTAYTYGRFNDQGHMTLLTGFF
jgi:hypothetical protein